MPTPAPAEHRWYSAVDGHTGINVITHDGTIIAAHLSRAEADRITNAHNAAILAALAEVSP